MNASLQHGFVASHKVHIYLDCMRLLGMLEMDDTEEEGIFGAVK